MRDWKMRVGAGVFKNDVLDGSLDMVRGWEMRPRAHVEGLVCGSLMFQVSGFKLAEENGGPYYSLQLARKSGSDFGKFFEMGRDCGHS
jgi:hypothetical protein